MDQDDNVDIDMSAALDEMSKDFSPEGGSTPVQEEAAPASPAAPVEPPAVATPEPWAAIPKSWKRDYESDWQNFRPEFKQYAHLREKQMLDGLMQYKTQFDPYAKIQEQYKPYLEDSKISLPQVTERMMNSHLALLYADPAMKQQYLTSLVKDYNLEPMLRQMFGGQPGAPAQQSPQGDITQQLAPLVQQMIQQHVGPIQRQLKERQQAEQQTAEQAMQDQVDKFVADPQNPFASELLEDMTQLITGGIASTLKDSYEKACRLNPTVWKKIQDAEVASLAKPKNPPPRNVRSGSTPPARTAPAVEGDMEATMRQIFSDINSR